MKFLKGKGKMLSEAQAKSYYEKGKKASKQYQDLFDAMWEMKVPENWHFQKAFQMGFDQIPWEVKKYQRLGSLPENASWNYRESCFERGVSVATDEWAKSIAGMFFAAKFGDRKTVKFNGVFTGSYGGDGEPLVLPVTL